MNGIIDKIVLNELETSTDEFRSVVSALCNKTVLVEKGGFLFSALIKENTLYIGILPYFIEGERAYHYNINLPEEKHILIGFINSNASIDIYFKLTKEEMENGIDEELLTYFRQSYISFCKILIEHGFEEDLPFGPLTINVFKETALFPNIPKNIKQVAVAEYWIEEIDGTPDRIQICAILLQRHVFYAQECWF